MVDISQIVESACLARSRAFRGIEKHRKKDCENKHGQTALRKQDEWLVSSVIHRLNMVSVQNYALVDQFLQPTKFPQIRFERVGETAGNLVTDACSGHSHTNGDTQIVSGDLTSIRRSQKLAVPKVVSRFAEVDDFWQLRAMILVVRALQRGFDHLPGCANLKLASRIVRTPRLLSGKKDS